MYLFLLFNMKKIGTEDNSTMPILPFKIPDKMVYITIHEYTDVHLLSSSFASNKNIYHTSCFRTVTM